MAHFQLYVEIIVGESLNGALQGWFSGLLLQPQPNGTRLSGPLQDRAELHGILERIRDLNLSLVSVQVENNPPERI